MKFLLTILTIFPIIIFCQQKDIFQDSILSFGGQTNQLKFSDTLTSVFYFVEPSGQLYKYSNLYQRVDNNTLKSLGQEEKILIPNPPDTLFWTNYSEIMDRYGGNGLLKSVGFSIFKDSQIVYWEYTDYCENGQVLHKHPVRKGERYQVYYCNGNLKEDADSAVQGWTPSGYTKLYYENGTILSEGLCVQEIPGGYSPQCISHGIWKFYNEKGDLTSIRKYEYGHILNEEEIKK